MNGLLRIAALTLVAFAIWLLGGMLDGRPDPRGLDAPPTEFSAARAKATLRRLLPVQMPHPVSSAANAGVRDRIRRELASLGVPTSLYRASGCEAHAAYGLLVCGTAEDIIAEVAPGQGKAVVLVAHYDSVPAGPGASDDLSGVATILETIRALKARGMKTRHPVIALLTDGEEAGLFGAASALDNPAFRARVGVAVNMEARGNDGPSLLFQTSAGDARLIDLYARAVPGYATSSLFAVIYRVLPNDTDLTVFLNHGMTGYNFSFIGDVAHYHTALDRIENLNDATLQHHGDNLLGMASTLMQTGFATLRGGDAIYLTLFGHLLPRLPASWALPLAAVVFVLLVFVAWRSRGGGAGFRARLAAAAIPMALLLAAGVFGWLLHMIASLVSGQPDPSYAHPAALRLALALGVLAVALLVSRLGDARRIALSVWLWMAGFAVVTALLLTGLSPYFLFPAVVAAILLATLARFGGGWSSGSAQIVYFAAALLPLAIWLSLMSAGETVQGLALHPLFTIPLGFGAMTLLPLLAAQPMGRALWLRVTSAIALAAVAVAVIAGLQPAYSTFQPQRLNITYVDDHVANKGLWAIETGAPLPEPFRNVAAFSDQPQSPTPLSFEKSYVASAGATRFALPTVQVSGTAAAGGRVVTLTLHGADWANRMAVVVPKAAGLVRAELDGRTFTPAANNLNPAGTVLVCATDDCRAVTMKLTFASRAPVDILVGEQRYGLPPDGIRLVGARPATTVPSQSGDTTTVFGKIRLP